MKYLVAFLIGWTWAAMQFGADQHDIKWGGLLAIFFFGVRTFAGIYLFSPAAKEVDEARIKPFMSKVAQWLGKRKRWFHYLDNHPHHYSRCTTCARRPS